MEQFLDILSEVMSVFGASIVVPIVLFVICLLMKVEAKKAFQSALNAGIGLTGFNLLIGAYTPIVTPVVQNMVDNLGVNLNIIDTGWQATSIVAYSTQVGMIFLALGLVIQTVVFLLKITNIFAPSDLWNNYSYMLWGSMLFITTNELLLSIGLMVLMCLYTLALSEVLQKRWSTYYGYPRTTIVASHDVAAVPIGIATNWLLNKIGANKIKWDPESLQEKLGFMGDPTFLGLVLGFLLGVTGNLDRLNTMEAWGQAATVAIATAAIMAIFPRVAGIFASAFTAITDASTKTAKKSGGKDKAWYLAINDAAGYGEPATLLTGIILIPTILLLSIILPGNKALPMVDLIAIPYMLQAVVPISNGNIFKSVIGGAIYLVVGLYLVTAVAPIFTDVAMSVGVQIPAGAMMIFSLAVLTNHLGGILFLVFMTQNPIFIGIAVIVYLVFYIFVRKNREKIHDYLEQMALEE